MFAIYECDRYDNVYDVVYRYHYYDQSFSIEFWLKDQRSALHEACRSKSTDEEGLAKIVSMLVEKGCDLNAKSSDEGEVKYLLLIWILRDIFLRNNCRLLL